MNANTKINSNKKIEKFKEGEFKNNPKKIIILINNNKELLKIKNKLVNLGGILVKGKWEFNID